MKKIKIAAVLICVILTACFAFGCGAKQPVALSVGKPQLIIKVNEEQRLSVKADGKEVANKVTYENTNDAVVSVSEQGVIKGLSEGASVIFIQAADGGYAVVEVVVRGIVPVALTALTVTGIPNDNTMKVGASVTLAVAPMPLDANDYYSIRWFSDNTNAVSVLDGVLTAEGVGTANITVSAGGTYINTVFSIVVTE